MELKVENVNKKYKNKQALKKFSCVFTEGINILLGPNGAGKSTLMNSIADAIKINSGEITFDGQCIFKMGKDFRKQLGYLPQNPEFYPFFTGRQIIEYFAVLKGLKKDEYNVEELMTSVNLSDAMDRKCGGYSGGMKRRLGIAVTMLGNPKVLIFDEPTAGLDPKERIVFKDNLKKLAKERIVIMATHIISDAEDIGSKIVIINAGEKLTEGSMDELIANVEAKSGKQGITLDDVYMHWFG
ncbi:MAG: ABC transporter ATP-binding protein [Butyrivibrio sp.]